jgi:transcriptional regulator with XRE-family HTH domain
MSTEGAEARAAFVAHLRSRRLELGLRLEDVARPLGVYNMTVHRWETGKRLPRAEVAGRWAGLLGVRVVGGSLAGLFRPQVPPCGTRRGYRRHERRGERCPECWAAHSAYNTAGYHRSRAQASSTGVGG